MQDPLTLFCLPCAGASAVMYLRWRGLLPSWVTLVPIELPGRGSRADEFPEQNCSALVQNLCDELLPSLPERYVLFGHSMGALLAYGIAHRLCAEQSFPPQALLVSGCAAPSRQDSQRYNNMQSDAALIADLGKQGGTSEEVFGNQELLSMTLDLLRVDYRVCGSFEYTQLQPLPIPIHVFAGRSDEISAAKLNDWCLENARICTFDWFDGGHFFLRQYEYWFLFVLKKRLMKNRAEALCETITSA